MSKKTTIANARNLLDRPAGSVETVEHNVPENALTVQQEEIVEQKEQVQEKEGERPSIEELKSKANNGDMEFEDFEEMVKNGELTRDEFREVLGVDFEGETSEELETKEAETSEINRKHNQPPADKAIDLEAEELEENLKNFTPLETTNAEEAREKLTKSLDRTLEHITEGDTSIRASLSLGVAEYTYWNTEGFNPSGNKLFHVTRKLRDEIQKNILELVPEEDRNATFKATVGDAVDGALLLMVGKTHIGYFMLPPDRKAVRQADVASPAYPKEIPDGYKVFRSICIKSHDLVPYTMVTKKDAKGAITIDRWEKNESEELSLCSVDVQKRLYASLWDKEGALQYNRANPGAPALASMDGRINGFKSGKQLADERKATEEAAKKQEEKNKAAEAETTTPASGTPATEEKEPETRDVGGVPAEAAELSKHVTDARQWLNSHSEGDVLKGEDLKMLREVFAELDHKRYTAETEAKNLAAFRKDDVASVLPAWRALVRNIQQPITTNSALTQIETTNDLLRHRIVPKIRPGFISREMVRDMLILKHMLDTIIDERDEEGNVVLRDIDETPVETYENLTVA